MVPVTRDTLRLLGIAGKKLRERRETLNNVPAADQLFFILRGAGISGIWDTEGTFPLQMSDRMLCCPSPPNPEAGILCPTKAVKA